MLCVASVKSIFISYRRDDSAGHAGRLSDGRAERVGAGDVFMDLNDSAKMPLSLEPVPRR